MSDRIVVCFRSVDMSRAPRDHVRGARLLSEQAAAMGGRLVAWSATVISFEFDPDALEDAIELAISVVLDSVPGFQFGVGISEGPLERTEDATARIPIAWGPPVVRATAFARSARLGEVLVDPALAAVRRGEVLTQGARVGVHGKERLRGLILDIKHPWRSAVAESVAALERPEFVGRPEIGELLIQSGTLGVVRADRGYGGTRLLEELERVLAPARTLKIAPHPTGEPLGGLRRALTRAVTAGQAPLAVDAKLGATLDALLAGEGLDPDSCAELLSVWLTPDAQHDPSGVVLIDDADDVDADTLEAVARAAEITTEPFRAIARVGKSNALPDALTRLRVATEVSLSPLASGDAVVLARACTRGEFDERFAERWAHRGGGIPLDIVEAIHEALESGELVWEDGRATGRFRGAGAGMARPAGYWIRRRFDYLDLDAQRTLQGLVVLGGEAESRDLSDVVDRRCGEGAVEVATAKAVLEASGWIVRIRPDLVAVTSSSQRDAVFATLTQESFEKWHLAVCDVLAMRSRPLAVASAAVHAALGADRDRAIMLSRRAAAAASAVGLEKSADAFEALAAGDSRPLVSLKLMPAATTARARSATPPTPAPEPIPNEESVTAKIESVIPVSLRPPAFPSLHHALAGAAHADGGEEEAESIGEFVVLDESLVVEEEPDVEVEPLTQRHPRTVERAEPRPGSEPPSSAVAALMTGDAATVERLAEELRHDPGRSGLAERLQAMAHLARGDTADALRRLRAAAEEAKRERSADMCRALLALGVALAAAQRPEEALLTALESLARARERTDTRGEQACARFIAQLTRNAGHAELAEQWQSIPVR